MSSSPPTPTHQLGGGSNQSSTSSTPSSSGPNTPTSTSAAAAAAAATTRSPMMSLFRFLQSPAITPSTSTTSSAPTTPATPVTRTLSDPTVGGVEGGSTLSPGLGLLHTKRRNPPLQRTHSLENDLFQLPDAATHTHTHPHSTPPVYRSFSVQSGFPIVEATQRPRSNGFLELLCKQDSFMNSD